MKRRIPALLLALTMVLSMIPSTFADGIVMNLRGNAAYNSEEDCYVLTEDATWQAGAIWFDQVKCNENFSLQLEFYTGHANHVHDPYGGADGICIAFYANGDQVGDDGEGLGFEGCGGFGVELDTYQNPNRGDPINNHIAILKNTVSNHLAITDATGFTEDGKWHTMEITNRFGVCTVTVDGVQQLQCSDVIPTGYFQIGITAATGSGCNYHAVRNIQLLEANFSEAELEWDEYCIQVVDENDNPLSGATVTWNAVSGLTDTDGKALFSAVTFEAPTISVSLDGYQTWTNESSNWQKSENRYSKVILYPTSASGLKLSSAKYSNSQSMNDYTDLLTTTKKVSLKNDGNLIGDLDFGNFYISCRAVKGATRYELWQNGKNIASTSTGMFPKLNVKSFSKGGGCFIRAIGSKGEMMDTAINLEFVTNDVNKDTTLNLDPGKLSVAVADNVPFLGGSKVEVNIPLKFKVQPVVSSTDDTIRIGINVDLKDVDPEKNEAEALKQLDEVQKSLEYMQKLKDGGLKKAEYKKIKKYIKEQTGADFFKKDSMKVDVMGYAEAALGSSTATGVVMVVFSIDAIDAQYNTIISMVPVTVQFEMTLGAEGTGTISYNWENATFSGSLAIAPSAAIKAFGGVGIGKAVGVGAYGTAELKANIVLLGKPAGVRTVDLTGELGLKAYVGWFTYERAFAHHTWNLYSANTVKSAPMLCAADPWNVGLSDASQLQIADLSYLSEESRWQGEDLTALEEGDGTVLTELLANTYRNAKPDLAATDTALYAAAVHADSYTGSRSVFLTAFNGERWFNPVSVTEQAKMDSDPVLAVDREGTIWLAYAKTAETAGESLLDFAQNQSIVVGRVDAETLAFTQEAVFSGNGYVANPRLSLVNGAPVLAWTEAELTDENSVLAPETTTVLQASPADGWKQTEMGRVNGSVLDLAAGDTGVACATTEGLVVLNRGTQVQTLAQGIVDRVTYETFPGQSSPGFLWVQENTLTASNGRSVTVSGLGKEYAISGNRLYYSIPGENKAELAVIQYSSGAWSLPVQITDGSRYLEDLSVAMLDGKDYVIGMHTAVTITEHTVEDSKNLVWGQVESMCDLQLDGISFDSEGITPGYPVPVTADVRNSGDKAVDVVAVYVNGRYQHHVALYLNPGETKQLTFEVPCPETVQEFTLEVKPDNLTDRNTADNRDTFSLGYSDLSVALQLQQVGTRRSLLATVTNIGIQKTGGTVFFCSADGTVLGESTFRDLTGGMLSLAAFDLPADLPEQDVYAQVIAREEEIHTWNNKAALHIGASAAVKQELLEVSCLDGIVTAQVSAEEPAQVCCAFYSENGRMISAQIQETTDGMGQVTFSAPADSATRAILFVLGDGNRPLCAGKPITIIR